MSIQERHETKGRAKGCASIVYPIPIKLVTVNQRYHVKSRDVEKDTTPFFTMLAINHP